MKLMQAKFNGRCSICGQGITRGSTIAFYGRGDARHASCAESDADASEADAEDERDSDSFPPSARVLAADRRSGLIVSRFSSGHVMTQNRRGRCEDAPCCGCCS